MAIQIVKQNYAEEVKAIKEAISICRYSVARQANKAQLGLYYSVGGYISQHTRNAKWGTGALNAISQQLQQEMPGLKGFSEGNMRKMRLFYEAWQPIFEKRSQVANEIEMVLVPEKLVPFDFEWNRGEFAERWDDNIGEYKLIVGPQNPSLPFQTEILVDQLPQVTVRELNERERYMFEGILNQI